MANEHVQELIGGILNDALERMTTQNHLRAILAAYERARDDPQTKLPAYLLAALDAALRNE